MDPPLLLWHSEGPVKMGSRKACDDELCTHSPPQSQPPPVSLLCWEEPNLQHPSFCPSFQSWEEGESLALLPFIFVFICSRLSFLCHPFLPFRVKLQDKITKIRTGDLQKRKRCPAHSLPKKLGLKQGDTQANIIQLDNAKA